MHYIKADEDCFLNICGMHHHPYPLAHMLYIITIMSRPFFLRLCIYMCLKCILFFSSSQNDFATHELIAMPRRMMQSSRTRDIIFAQTQNKLATNIINANKKKPTKCIKIKTENKIRLKRHPTVVCLIHRIIGCYWSNLRRRWRRRYCHRHRHCHCRRHHLHHQRNCSPSGLSFSNV